MLSSPSRHRRSLAPPTHTCPTGCVFGSDEHAAHSAATSTSVSREHLVEPPGGIPISTTYDANHQVLLADLIAQYGSSSSTAWLDSTRYKIWRPSQPIPESLFTPVQGYMQKDHFIFAWGNPLVSSPAALERTVRAFIAFVEANHLHPVWCCVDHDLEAILTGNAHEWATVSCIHEDVMDPVHVIELMSPEHIDSELKKNLSLAEKDHVEVREVRKGDWDEAQRDAVETFVKEWKEQRPGMEFDSMAVEPWVDEAHRRYWIAKKKGKIIGLEILSQTSTTAWHIVKCLVFRRAAAGVYEKLIYTALQNLCDEQEELSITNSVHSVVKPGPKGGEETIEIVPEPIKNRVMISFGVTAADHLDAGHNISGWKVNVLSKTYHAVSGFVGLLKTSQYREKFDVVKEPLYVCYPSNHFGLLAISALLVALRK